jgi:hemolysin activation/secretion protein
LLAVALLPASIVLPAGMAEAQQSAPVITGLVFVDGPAALQRQGATLAPGESDHLDLSRTPRLDSPDFRRVAAAELGRPLTLETIRAVTADLNRFFADGGQPFVILTMPPQDVTNGVVQVVAVQGKLGAVTVEGNRWFDAADYRGAIRSVPGEPVDKTVLDQDIAWLNRNPYHQVAMVAQPSKTAGQTDLVLRAQDRMPLGVDFAFDNTGPHNVGTYRLTMGAEYGDLFGRGDVVSYHYTADPQFRLLAQHAGSYTALLPWRDVFSINASYADVTTELPAPLSLTGYSWQVSPRYEITLAPLGDWTQHFIGGLDFKHSTTNLLFSNIPVSGTPLDIFQFTGTYGGQIADHYGTTAANLSLTVSPGGVTGDNNDAAFAAQRFGAESRYAYVTVDLDRETPLPRGMTLSSRLRGQLASTALAGTEQLEFGGFAGVRGYRTGQLFADQGVIQRNELGLAPIAALRDVAPRDGRLSLYGFFDWGVSSDRHPVASDVVQTLAGFGLGLRLDLDRFVHIRAEYGLPLIGVPANGSDGGQWYVSLAIAY